jgi:dUTP pyrophosphatase
LRNSIGVIDSGYRGEIILKFDAFLNEDGLKEWYKTTKYKEGDRIGQLIIMPYPYITLVESNELSETERGNGGFGSSGE